MDQPTSADQLQRLLAGLYVQPGISGACLQLGGTILIHDLPYSDERVANLASRINHLITSYESVGREIWQVCAGFENFRLLILCSASMRLSLLLQPGTDPALAAGRGMHLLMEVKNVEPQQPVIPPPPPTTIAINAGGAKLPREEFETLITGMMGRVTGATLATKLVQREFVTQKLNGSPSLAKDEAKRIGLAILEHIPNRGKRAALAAEFLNILES